MKGQHQSDDDFEEIQRKLYVSETERLQGEADMFTRLLEHERKNYLILKDQYKNKKKDLEEIEEKIKAKIPDERTVHQEKVARASLQHRLQNEKVLLNKTIGENNKLYEQINIMRMELASASRQIQAMEEQIEKFRNKATDSNKHATKDDMQASDINNQILALKAKHEEGKQTFEYDIKKLQEQLKDKDKRFEYNEKSLNQTMKDSKGPGQGKQDFANPIEILKIRVNNLTNKNKEKRRLLEQYVRNAKIIQEAFETIMEATGITGIDEIVTTFIKAEEQNVALFNYVNQLSQESDALEEQNKYHDEQVQSFQNIMAMTNKELQKQIDENAEREEVMRARILKNSQEINDVEEDFREIQKISKELSEKFREVQFINKVAQSQSYDDHTHFTENNVGMYLSELEEYISALITYQSTKQGEPNCNMANLPFGELPTKDWKEKDISIDAPFDTTVKTSTGEEEESTYDIALLKKRFEDKIEKSLIVPVTRGDGQRHNNQ